MAVLHIKEYCSQNENLEEDVQPQLSHEQREPQEERAAVEGDDVCVLHQRQAATAELRAQRGGNVVAVLFVDGGNEFLEFG